MSLRSSGLQVRYAAHRRSWQLSRRARSPYLRCTSETRGVICRRMSARDFTPRDAGQEAKHGIAQGRGSGSARGRAKPRRHAADRDRKTCPTSSSPTARCSSRSRSTPRRCRPGTACASAQRPRCARCRACSRSWSRSRPNGRAAARLVVRGQGLPLRRGGRRAGRRARGRRRCAPAHGPAHGAAGIPGVAAIIAVASGKGGVGKSTIAVNLALGAARRSASRSACSTPTSTGRRCRSSSAIREQPRGDRRHAARSRSSATACKVMSIGFLVEEETPMIWRGPMVMSALTQMLREVEWGTLDVWWSTCRRAPATRSSPWRSRCRSPAPSSSRRRRTSR